MYSWSRGTNVLLADEMGLGKTIQSIGFVAALHALHAMHGPALIVVPLSTIDAWRREFVRWAPQLNVVVYAGDARSRAIQRHYEWGSASRPLFNVLLTTYELALKERVRLSGIAWRLLIVDEGHRLKNAASQLHEALNAFSPNARMLVTGTPLQNSLQELWALLSFLEPERFASHSAFVAEYGTDDAASGAETEKRLNKLHALLKPHMLRRMKADVETSLPTKSERILRVELSAEQRQLYRLVLTRNYRELAARSSLGSLNNILVELKKASVYSLCSCVACRYATIRDSCAQPRTSPFSCSLRASWRCWTSCWHG